MFCEPKRLQRSGGGREAEVKSERETKKKRCVCVQERACLVCVRVCDGGAGGRQVEVPGDRKTGLVSPVA